jgi:hypothetical protein
MMKRDIFCNPVREEKRLSPQRKKRYFSATSYDEKRGRGKDSTDRRRKNTKFFSSFFTSLSLSLPGAFFSSSSPS